MGKVFITDEVRQEYTADVTQAGKLKVENGVSKFVMLNSASTLTSAQVVSSTPCYVKSVIFGRMPATAATLHLFDTDPANATGLEGYSALGTSGEHFVSVFQFPLGSSSGTCALTFPVTNKTPCTVPINVYCASGLIACISSSANLASGYLGCLENCTITYQT